MKTDSNHNRSPMERVKVFWKRMSNLGIEQGQSHSSVRSIRLANQLSMVTALLTMLYLAFELIFLKPHILPSQRTVFYITQIAIAVSFGSILLLNYYHQSLVSRILFCLLTPFAFLPNAYLLSQPLRAEFYMYGFASIVFLFFQQKRLITLLFTVPVIVFLLMTINLQNHYPGIFVIDSGAVVRISISFFMIYVAMTMLVGENTRYETEIENQNQELVNQRNELSEANAIKNKIFSIVGHDLRGPIGSLHAMLQMVEKSQISQEEFQQFTKSLRINVKYLHGTLDNLLQWAQVQVRDLKTAPQDFYLNALLEEVIQLTKFSAEAKGITIEVHGRTDFKIFADLTMMRSVLINLISNAVKFTHPDGFVKITTSINQYFAKISVQDNGRGMTPEMIRLLFKSTEHLSTPGTNNERGTGLGLLLCKEFVEKNGGTISVTSELGKGSDFSFTFPLPQKSLASMQLSA